MRSKNSKGTEDWIIPSPLRLKCLVSQNCGYHSFFSFVALDRIARVGRPVEDRTQCLSEAKTRVIRVI